MAEKGGRAIGAEAHRASGFNEHLAGGVSGLSRWSRQWPRISEIWQKGEDPLLTGLMMVGAFVKGIRSSRIVATVKHYALNDQETGRTRANVIVDEAAARSASDLLAFQIRDRARAIRAR